MTEALWNHEIACAAAFGPRLEGEIRRCSTRLHQAASISCDWMSLSTERHSTTS